MLSGIQIFIFFFVSDHLKRAGTERGTSSIIKSGQKDTEASIAYLRLPITLQFDKVKLDCN